MTIQARAPAAVAVRPLEPGDFAAWKPLWDGYNAFYGRHGDNALPDALTRVTWQRFFDPGEPMFGLVAEADGAVLGLAHYLYHRSTTRMAPNCYLQDLFTLDVARGRGIGRALIQAVYQAAAEAGVDRVYWQTQAANATARRLYDAMADNEGFIVYSHEGG